MTTRCCEVFHKMPSNGFVCDFDVSSVRAQNFCATRDRVLCDFSGDAFSGRVRSLEGETVVWLPGWERAGLRKLFILNLLSVWLRTVPTVAGAIGRCLSESFRLPLQMLYCAFQRIDLT